MSRVKKMKMAKKKIRRKVKNKEVRKNMLMMKEKGEDEVAVKVQKGQQGGDDLENGPQKCSHQCPLSISQDP